MGPKQQRFGGLVAIQALPQGQNHHFGGSLGGAVSDGDWPLGTALGVFTESLVSFRKANVVVLVSGTGI